MVLHNGWSWKWPLILASESFIKSIPLKSTWMLFGISLNTELQPWLIIQGVNLHIVPVQLHKTVFSTEPKCIPYLRSLHIMIFNASLSNFAINVSLSFTFIILIWLLGYLYESKCSLYSLCLKTYPIEKKICFLNWFGFDSPSTIFYHIISSCSCETNPLSSLFKPLPSIRYSFMTLSKELQIHLKISDISFSSNPFFLYRHKLNPLSNSYKVSLGY